MSRWGVIAGFAVAAMMAGFSAVPARADATRVRPVAGGAAATRVLSVAGGDSFSCGVDESGVAFCWGANYEGELGDGTTTPLRATPGPVAMRGLPAGTTFTTVVAGIGTACGLAAGGAAYCWGGGNPGHTGGSVPIAVPGGLAFTALTDGGGHTCGLAVGGVAYCWGWNSYGELGDGTTTNRSQPVAVAAAGTRFTALTAGEDHTCGLATGGAVLCWGGNAHGQVGDGTEADRTRPVAVAGSYTAVEAGYEHTCALTTAGEPYCWGDNNAGQAGASSAAELLTPTRAHSGAPALTALTAGDIHTCGLAAGGAVHCWGFNSAGQLGDGTTEQRNGIVRVVADGLAFAALSAGQHHTCGITAAGGAYCWGENRRGQLGNGTTTNPMVPAEIPVDGPAFAALSTGQNHTCGLTEAGAAYCWGRNIRGQVGDGTTDARSRPVAVSAGRAFTEIETGEQHTCALTASGAAYCWGWNYSGQLGNGSGRDESEPVAVLPSGLVFTQLTAGDLHTCGLTGAGVAYCWGGNDLGQLGDGTTTDRPEPTAVSAAGTRFTSLSAGGNHTCGLTAAGAAYCWGYNPNGQLGDGTTTVRLAPVAVAMTGFGAIAAGYRNTCALTLAGAAYCWGDNRYGQLGDNTLTNRLRPVAVSAPTTFAAIDMTWNHTCALTAGGAAYCWGSGDYWELGYGDNLPVYSPVAVAMPAGVTFAGLTIGSEHSCARTAAGVAYCWGRNDEGQLGMGLPWLLVRVPDFPEPVEPAPDTTPPAGTFTLSSSSLWSGQRTTLTLSGVADDVSAPDRIGRVVTWGDGTTTKLDPAQASVTKQYARAGRFPVTLTLTDAAGNKRTRDATVTVTVPGTFRLDKTSVWHGETFRVTISAVPAGTTRIALNWGDGSVGTLKGANQSVTHRYDHRFQGALRPTAVFTNGNGASAPVAVGTVTIRRDSWNPRATITKPKKPARVASWKTVRGTAADRGSGVRIVRVGAARAAGGKLYCYTAKKTWIRVAKASDARCGIDVTVSGGKWSLALKGLAKGKLTVTAVAVDRSARRSGTAKVTQSLTA